MTTKIGEKNTEMGDGVCFMNEPSFLIYLKEFALYFLFPVCTRETEKRMKRGSEGGEEKLDQESF